MGLNLARQALANAPIRVIVISLIAAIGNSCSTSQARRARRRETNIIGKAPR
jgi:hypothetical protein